MLLIIIILAVFGTVTTATVALLRKPNTVSIESRIQDFRARTAMGLEDEIDLDAPFVERVLKPGVEGIARAAGSILPKSVLAEIQRQLIMAGNPMKQSTFVTFWMACLFTFGGLGFVMFLALPSSMILQKLLMLVAFSALGWMVPRMWLKGKVKTKQKAVLKALPDSLDLITTCVEAGLGLDAALSRVAEKSEGPLAKELSHMLRDVAMGKLRREAMVEMGERVGVDELTTFINAVIQAEQLGVSIAQVLRVQSDQLRTKRRQSAERQAHEAPIKMLFPLVLFIFPAFLLVILGPAMIRIAGSLGN